ncbi:uncharacterized protein ASPGLDRAFT_1516059 [Aspergillus glaucus CBS 516.65]|uniref:Secreted protein n=1 Tax=Aspergillus glaucus CBS 516.65 TaxID=1160497 RepID=A0A1L9VN81_ASPGL|nr:hypothetical protein ASPGLDRAFT_1516059 [Aspergillus glaucus CBS 516.65]OJJ85351.1 hypothetical protein ASPGLDRAFT_1516059 [Aspergillus glaucus CBS 516.65]
MRTLTWLETLLLVPAVLGRNYYGSFEDPASDARVKFRYWLPDASVDISTVQSDIESAGSIGAGGVQLLPLYNYGGSLAPPPEGADWATYGFGTPAFNRMFKASLKAVTDAGMVFDFGLGPNQGQGVPAVTTDEGLHWDLAPFNASVPANGSYNDIIPGWGTGELVALVSAEVLSSSIIQNPASATFSTPSTNSTRLVLRSDSLTDQTNKVHDGIVNLRFNATGDYRLFAYYQYQDLAKNLDIQTNTTGTIFDNGSYTVDHFSARGAQTTIDFWEKHILNDTETKELLSEVGKYAWEDSLEIKSNISWSPSLPQHFREANGYDLQKYLPLVQFGNNNPGVQPSYPGDLACVLDSEDSGKGFVNDYREALAQGYQSYLKTLTSWAEGLGLEFSGQVSYNLPLDMESSIEYVNAPECESLAFNDNIDGYRQFAGVANVAQKQVISNEMGGDLRKAFKLTVSHLLWQINSAFAGGVNQVVLHGQTYTGNYFDTTWPGYTAFFMLFSESYNDKQPAWLHSYPEAIAYASRNQYILHHGQPRTDVAFFNKASVTDPQVGTVYSDDDLINAGYTYTYLSPENFNMTNARVANGILAPESPAYKAMVVTSYQNVTLDAVKQLQKFAQDGLPIILSGGLPGYYASSKSADGKAVSPALQTLKNTKNVYTVGTHEIAQKLTDLNLAPRVCVQTNGTWYPVFRTDNTTDYVFIFSTANSASSGTITVQTTKTPYFFDSWSGKRAPVLQYQVQNGSLSIPLRLASNQTVVLAFSNELASEIDTPSAHAVQLPSNILGYNYTKTNGLALHVAPSTQSSTATVKLSNGKRHSLPRSRATPFKLSNWTLTAEHWEAPSNFTNASIPAVKHNTTHNLQGTHLPSWLDIQGLRNTSGVGYYTTTFTWPSSNETTGAYISLPRVPQGLQVSINDQRLPSLDFSNPTADIGSYLVKGMNEVEIVVPTVMWNYIRSLYDRIQIAGSEPMLSSTGALPENEENGLVGEMYSRNSVPA